MPLFVATREMAREDSGYISPISRTDALSSQHRALQAQFAVAFCEKNQKTQDTSNSLRAVTREEQVRTPRCTIFAPQMRQVLTKPLVRHIASEVNTTRFL